MLVANGSNHIKALTLLNPRVEDIGDLIRCRTCCFANPTTFSPGKITTGISVMRITSSVTLVLPIMTWTKGKDKSEFTSSWVKLTVIRSWGCIPLYVQPKDKTFHVIFTLICLPLTWRVACRTRSQDETEGSLDEFVT